MLIFDSKPILYSLFVITGSALGIIAKILQSIESYGNDFKHPFIYSLTLFLSETTGIITYYLFFKKEDIRQIKLKKIKTKIPMKMYYLIIPAVFDLFSSSFGMLSFENLPASITTMFDGGNTIGVFLLSIFFLKNKHSKYNFMGVLLLIIGLFFISLSAINDDKKEKESNLKETLIGILCCILCNIFTSFHAITEEYLFKTRICHPIKLIGFEGLFGSCFSFIFLMLFSYIQFGNNLKFICIQDENGTLFIENIFLAIKQMMYKKIIIFTIICQFFIFILYNYSYIVITNVADAATNVVLYNLTALFIWIFFLLPIDKKNQEKIGFFQCLGFLILVLGVLIYNEIIFVNKNKIKSSEIKNIIKDGKEGSELNDDPLIDI